MADVKGFGKRKRDSARNGKLRGMGYSAYIEACGIAPSQAVGSLGAGVGLWESAEVRVNPTGSVEILTEGSCVVFMFPRRRAARSATALA